MFPVCKAEKCQPITLGAMFCASETKLVSYIYWLTTEQKYLTSRISHVDFHNAGHHYHLAVKQRLIVQLSVYLSPTVPAVLVIMFTHVSGNCHLDNNKMSTRSYQTQLAFA